MESNVDNSQTSAPSNVIAVKGKWLTLKEASAFLGVHFTTLRGWADRGEIPVFRT
ncbi:MAG: helix-turn-helix domain-containing protein, partial [Caldilineaceae bacterium]|nr:helix-turn-helix domain-containing protein [Caldilineaceae bacterium]MCB0150441.1 helix-turn-helix domain-containing protein [Caldilineaceae bacterium]